MKPQRQRQTQKQNSARQNFVQSDDKMQPQ